MSCLRAGIFPLSHGPNGPDWKAAHAAMQADERLWRSLAFEGPEGDDRGGLLELRRCPRCASTLGRPIFPAQALEICRLSAELHARSVQAVAVALAASECVPHACATPSSEHEAV